MGESECEKGSGESRSAPYLDHDTMTSVVEGMRIESATTAFTGTTDFKGTEELFPEEGEIIQRAIRKRRSEFATGRWCARKSLERLGFPAVPILCGGNREPIWPEGIAGSISHTNGYCCAVVSTSMLAIGIDVEFVDEKVSPEIWGQVLDRDEAGRIGEMDSVDRLKSKFAVFSAKESFYKCIFPLVRKFISFHQVDVELFPAEGRFRARLKDGLDQRFRVGDCFDGDYRCRGPLVLSHISLTGAGRFPRNARAGAIAF